MSYLVPAEIPYGAFWCPTCLCVRACCVAVGHSASEPDCPLECITCDTRIGEVVDEVGVFPFPPIEVRRSTLTREEREAGRALGRKLVLGQFELPIPGEALVKKLPTPPPDFVGREAARLASLRGRP